MGARDLASALLGSERRSVSFQKVWGDGGDWATASGQASVEAALGLPALFGCVDIIAGQISAMPLQTFRRDASGRRRVEDGPLVTAPSDRLSPDEWVYAAVASMLVHGEAIGLETRRGPNGWPSAVEWIDPRTVDIRPGTTRPEYWVGGELIAPDRVTHVRHGLILPGQLRGTSPIASLRDPLRTGLEMIRYELDWFRHGAHPSGILSVDVPTLTDEQSSKIKARFLAAVRRREPAVLSSIAGYTPLVEDPSSAGLDAARVRIATDIAVAFHVPPGMVGGDTGKSLTYSTLETDQAALDVRALMPPYRRFELALSRLMPRPTYVRFCADATLRTDAATRARVASELVRAGVKSRDEVRALEELAPIPDGTGGEFLWPPYSTAPTTTGGGQ